ncbi:MAG: glycosyltransferase [Bacteroidota bacterium]
MNKILIISTKIGGINTITASIKENLCKKGDQVEVIYFEECTNALFLDLITNWYLKKIPSKIRLWKLVYENAWIYQPFFKIVKFLFPSPKVIYPRAFEIVSRVRFNHIIVTSFYPSFIAEHLVEYFNLNCKTHAILSNFDFPEIWSKKMDYYYLPNREIAPIGIANGYEEKKFVYQNIPIHEIHMTSRVEEDDKKVVLFTGGSLGLGISIEKVKIALSQGHRVVVICGENDALFESLSQVKSNCLNIYKSVDLQKMHELYSQSICVITKAGTLTLAEAAANRIPIVLSSFLDGHEQKNADFLVKKRACLIGIEVSQFKSSMTEVVNRRVINKMLDNAYNLFFNNHHINLKI